MPTYYPSPDFAAEDIAATGDISAVGNISTTLGTVSAEQVTSTDDANVADQLKLTEAAGAHTATPTLAFGDLDTGLFESADDTLNIVSEGVVVLTVNTGDQVIVAEAAGAHAAAPSLAFGDADTGLYESADDVLNVVTAGVGRLQFGSGYVSVANAAGSAARFALDYHTLELSADLTPTGLSGDVTDYNPTNLARSVYLRVDPGAAGRVINSLAGGVSGRIVVIMNISATQTLSLLHDDTATGTAAMRFLCPGSVTTVIPVNGSRMVMYDTTSSRWRVLGAVA